ncbi:MAG: ABC transporter ATP-binding protein [candidate division NC10 bacterium]|nr:ABC transporter ATP-binding protein [candidate division NC10 bacterium]
MSEAKAVVELQGLAKHYRRGGEVVKALDGVDLRIDGTGMVAIVGPSGSGKSTLLHMIGAMDRPTRGEAVVAGQALNGLPEKALTRFRRQTVGFVFQTFNLVPNLTALENVTLPMEFNKVKKAERNARARRLLDQVGLGHRLTHRPGELSGGEQQRVAIARALANDPPLILADEPTGNLDTESGEKIYELLKEVARQRTVLVVTHAEPLARMADRILYIKDGRFVGAA